ncbi:membrane-bound lytic murein transglycosylase MltC [Sodalis sp. CWE]|uniref:membrane-bound lytic murein transglycosylase MltC n=1 Tax=Sodalis sp. CWE TaxID=2803816 RepID=UPI001C7DDEF7|nr:membrane-bound lytic murein transglycosylase MltC [Sodalis sp. CWE]MBX4180902.1 membrane-bound lytic murein transglycosylase MltC [Sodalis sp. CWE]
MKKKLLSIIVPIFLTSCSINKNSIESASYTVHTKNTHVIKDIYSFDILMWQLAHNIEDLWGPNEILINTSKVYINYTDQCKTRSHINFNTGLITVETIANSNPNIHLRAAIINSLLINNYLKMEDLHLEKNNIALSKKPFLHGQTFDHTGKVIRWKWRASRFADYLLRNQLQTRFAGPKQVFYITIQLVPDCINERSYKYLNMIFKASKEYNVDRSLILAIIQTESNFNPYAVSRSNALGLMQVVQHSAGRDVFKMKGKYGQPSRSYLFDPRKNIDSGTAYLAMLQNDYFSGIIDPISRRYAVITAYNGGAGSVLRVFSPDPNQAIQIINRMQSDEVYQTLFTRHPSIEARQYLYKVNNLQNNYWQH